MAHVGIVSTSKATYGLLTENAMARVGGAELQQVLIARCLRKSGHEVSFLVHDFDQANVMVNEQGIRLVKTFGLRDGGFLLKHITPLRLFRGLNIADADVYYQRTASFITGLVSAYCKARGRKFIFAVASNMDVDGSRERAYNCFERALYRYGVRSADVILVQTNDQAQMLESRFRRTGIVIPNIYEMPQTEETERRYVLWVANFYALKRPQMLLEVARQIPECKFVMVGSPVDAEPDVYRDAVAAVEHLPNVEIRGPVPYSEVGSIYSEAFAFTCTSVIEGFPNTYLDALSRGVPVVSTFDPDEIICRHRLGFHCQTVDGMVSSLGNLLSNSELQTALGENGRQYVKSVHAMEVVRDYYDDLLAKLVEGGSVTAEPVCSRTKQGDSSR